MGSLGETPLPGGKDRRPFAIRGKGRDEGRVENQTKALNHFNKKEREPYLPSRRGESQRLKKTKKKPKP